MKNKQGDSIKLNSNNAEGVKMAEDSGYKLLDISDTKKAIKQYTKDNSSINKQLREGKVPKQVLIIDEFLDNQPSYKGKVYRGITLKDSEVDGFIEKVKRTGLVDKAYTSTTESMGDAMTFARTSKSNGTKGIILEIEGKNGKKIDRSLNSFNEEEILFKRGTKFGYTGEYNDAGRGLVIQLIER